MLAPVWFMRQAGRSAEYRKVREGMAMLVLAYDLNWCRDRAQPVRRLDVDAAVLFGDITVPLFLAGVDVRNCPGWGRLSANHPSAADVADLPDLDPAALAPVTEAISLVVKNLAPSR